MDCAAKSKQNKSRNGFTVRQTPALLLLSCVFEALPVKFPASCQSFSRLALVSWCLSRTHAPVSGTRFPRLAFFFFAVVSKSVFSFFFFFLCRCELRCMFERKLPRTTLQVLNLLRLRPVRVVLRERRHDDETHHRAPHAVYINPGRLR